MRLQRPFAGGESKETAHGVGETLGTRAAASSAPAAMAALGGGQKARGCVLLFRGISSFFCSLDMLECKFVVVSLSPKG